MSKDLATKDLRKRVLKVALIVLVIVLVFSGAVLFALVRNGVSLYAVSGESMEPTFSDKDSLIITQEDHVAFNQIVFFDKPDVWDEYADNDMTLVKRIVAVPGDTLTYDGTTFAVNGIEFYNTEENGYECDAGDAEYSHVLTDKEIFVTGDNANKSLDSRRIFCDGNSDDMYVPYQSIKNYGEVVYQF